MRIAHDLIAHQQVADRCGRALAARLEYRAEEPYEVRLLFHTDRPDPVVWVFGRDLLLEGLRRPCGSGDVRIRPAFDGGRHLLSVVLAGDTGTAVVEIPAAEAGAFALRTLRLVPEGEEVQRLDVDSLTASPLLTAGRLG